MGFLVHYALILNILLFTGLFFFKKSFSPILFFVLYMGGITIFSANFFTNFIDVVQQVDLGTRFLAYQENAAMWLDPEEQKVGGDFSYLNVLATFFFMFAACKMVKTRPEWTYVYNLSLIACVCFPISQKLELLMRLEYIIYIFKIVMTGVVMMDVLKNRKYYGKCMYMFAVIFLAYYLCYSYMVRESFMTSDPPYYIWDAHGRKTLI